MVNFTLLAQLKKWLGRMVKFRLVFECERKVMSTQLPSVCDDDLPSSELYLHRLACSAQRMSLFFRGHFHLIFRCSLSQNLVLEFQTQQVCHSPNASRSLVACYAVTCSSTARFIVKFHVQLFAPCSRAVVPSHQFDLPSQPPSATTYRFLSKVLHRHHVGLTSSISRSPISSGSTKIASSSASHIFTAQDETTITSNLGDPSTSRATK
jgi:hypothetical protein